MLDLLEDQFLMFKLDRLADSLALNRDVIKMTLGKSELPLNKNILNAITEAVNSDEKRNKVYSGGSPHHRCSGGGVATVPGEDFGLKKCLRVSFTAIKFNEGIDRLAEYLNNNKNQQYFLQSTSV